jgi:Fe-S-cluster-containing hydrogenase component 2
MSAGDGIRLSNVINEFTAKIQDLGPLGKGEDIEEDELRSSLEGVRKLIPYIKIVKREKLAKRLRNREEYDGFFTREEMDALFRGVISYYINPEKCQACMICLKRCPVDAISGRKRQIHVIDQDICLKCGTCLDACPPHFSAVQKISGTPVPPPVPEDERAIIRIKKRSDLYMVCF